MKGGRRNAARSGSWRGADRGLASVGARLPSVGLSFWTIALLAAALGRSSATALASTLDLGPIIGAALFTEVFAAAVAAQMAVRSLHPFLFWTVVVAAAIAGGAIVQLARTLLVDNQGAAFVLAVVVAAAVLALGYRATAPGDRADDQGPGTELMFWIAVLLSQIAGLVMGDWMLAASADSRGVVMIAIGVAFVVTLIGMRRGARGATFWMALALGSALAVALAGWIDGPAARGGLGLNRFSLSALLLAALLLCVLHAPQPGPRRAGPTR